MKISRELKTGIVSVAIVALFIWGYNFMKGQNLFAKTGRTYFAEYTNVQGLNSASIVTINGFKVGKVVEITFNPKKQGELVVEFSVDSDFQFSKNSTTKIYSTSLMGGKAIAVLPTYEGENAVSGDYLKGILESDLMTTVGEMLTPLQVKLTSVIVNADSLIVGLNQVLDQESRKNLKSAFASLNSTLSSFEKASESLDDILTGNKEKLDASLTNVEVITDNFAKLSDSLANANLGQTLEDLQVTVAKFNSILTTIDNGEGTIGKLLKEEGLYNNLENASKELEELLREVKEHPKRFVSVSIFGKKDKGYKPSEEPVEEDK